MNANFVMGYYANFFPVLSYRRSLPKSFVYVVRDVDDQERKEVTIQNET